jgi:hypothetical protein
MACVSGELTPEGLAQFRSRVDFYREWLGLATTLDPDPALMADAQACATMMGVAQKLSHHPDTSWPCYTEAGAKGASQSNIGYAKDTPGQAIDAEVFDFGNEDNPGHRRWLFAKDYTGLGFGFFDAGPGGDHGRLSGHCVVAFDGYLNADALRTEKPVVYPPAGAFPAALADGRPPAGPHYKLLWSISWHGASFAGATLSLTDANGDAIALAQPFLELPPNYGADAASFIPDPRPEVGEQWTVRIDGILLDGVPQLPLVYRVDFVDCGAKTIW